MLQKAVALFEEEVISDQLVLHFLGHSLKRIIGAAQFRICENKFKFLLIQYNRLTLTSLKLLENCLDFRFHLQVVLLGQTGIERIAL